MTIDDPRNPHEREFDDHVAARLRRAVAGMDLPAASAARARSSGHQLQLRARLAASAGAVALVVAAITVATAIRPLGTGDVVQGPSTAPVPATTADPTPVVCPAVSPTVQQAEPRLPEARLEPAGIQGWALLFTEPPWPTGEQVKVVWRLDGTGDPDASAIGPSDTVVDSDDLTPHGGSNWDRPGDEWGTIWTFDEPGCWELRMARAEGSASLTVRVVDPDDPNEAGLTAAQFEARIDRARAALSDVDEDNVVHAAMADDVVTESELVTALERTRSCARDADPTAEVTTGHIGDVSSSAADGNAVERCIAEHYQPTIRAFVTLFAPSAGQQAAVPDCPQASTDCLDEAETVVDGIIRSNLRLVGELGHTPEPAAPSDAGQAAAQQLHAAARADDDRGLAQFAQTWLASDEVELWLGPTTLDHTATPADLVDPDGWVLSSDDYAGYTGPFSGLDALADVDDITVSTGPQPNCAAPARPAPAGLEGLERIAIEPAESDSCLDWFVVNLWVDDGHVRAVQLDLYEP